MLPEMGKTPLRHRKNAAVTVKKPPGQRLYSLLTGLGGLHKKLIVIVFLLQSG